MGAAPGPARWTGGWAGPWTVNLPRWAPLGTARAQARRWDARGFVFSTSTGHPLSSQNVTRDLHAALAAAGLPRLRFHDLRHAFATLQLEAGADVFEVSRALGHASIATTANTYGHFTRAMAERSADRMTTILGEPASG